MAVWFSLGACGSTEPEQGTLRVAVVTDGGDIDLDGYFIEVDSEEPRLVTPTGLVRIPGLTTGTHRLALTGIAENCDLSGSPTLTVTIESDRTTEIRFEVTCYATGIAVSTVTTGLDAPGGYTITIGGEPQFVPRTGTVVRGHMAEGTYDVVLFGLSANCSILGQPPGAVTVSRRQVTPVTIAVICVAVTGVVELKVRTTGVDPDPTGYRLRLGALHSRIPPNADSRFEIVPPGDHVVLIDEVAPNCLVQGPDARSVQVRGGGLTRDTARAEFEVACVRTEKIAFVQGGLVHVAYADGSHAVIITSGSAPAWSPRGDLLVLERLECSGFASYSGGEPGPPPCVPSGLATIALDGSSLQAVTGWSLDRNPVWSPDGETIAFDREGRINLARPGSPDIALNPAGIRASDPTWSPDGSRLAFVCEFAAGNAGNLDICAMNRDGTALLRLTDDPAPDTEPAWSPDGTRIALTTMRFNGREDVALLDPSGGQVVRVAAGRTASWSGDGTRLVFSITGLGLATVRPDGTGLEIISRQGEYAPAWRP